MGFGKTRPTLPILSLKLRRFHHVLNFRPPFGQLVHHLVNNVDEYPVGGGSPLLATLMKAVKASVAPSREGMRLLRIPNPPPSRSWD